MQQKQLKQRSADEKIPRVWIEGVLPQVDCGRFPVKRTVGEKVEVSASVFADGHDLLQAVVQYRHVSGKWLERPMVYRGDDLWIAEFQVDALGTYEYTVRGWIDHFASWQRDLLKKFQAGQNVASDLLEGAAMIDATAPRALSPDDDWLSSTAALLRVIEPQETMVARATAPDVTAMMRRYPERSGEAVFSPPLAVTVETKIAGFGAWYEVFPRSVTTDSGKSGTFRSVEQLIPEIVGMGFDVLYLPPIHPIGRTNRKGRNNSLQASPEDPGSPWAIGGPEGGHKDVHPELGTIDDFENLVKSAKKQGLEIALDLAFQCSPDHPYVREHPEWFRHHPDGTIRFAENPPKKYEDIYPFFFDCEEWVSLWDELKSIVY